MAKNNKFVMVGLPLVVRRNTCFLGEYFLRCLYTTFMKFKGPFFSFSMLHSFHQSYILTTTLLASAALAGLLQLMTIAGSIGIQEFAKLRIDVRF